MIFTRRVWNERVEQLGDVWRMRKGTHAASAIVVSHPLGVELRLMIGDDLRHSQVFKDDDEPLLALADEWKAAMAAKGWS